MKLFTKIKALIQWFYLLELQAHPHWCHYYAIIRRNPDGTYNEAENPCVHRMRSWQCTGLFCAFQERKNCPNCEAKGCHS